ncbi:MAG: fumarylacetoacetate hydrolase family protein [Flavobacteriaceae bacterium]|nr:fumarylacetoacetate hydrolase family protein [Flavobacteriaceae bacterium]
MKIICIGRNYAKHIEELSNQKPDSPVVFMKPDSAIVLKNNPFIIPHFSDEIHYETEVLVKINKVGKNISPEFSHKYYDEIGLGIDFTARDVQEQCKTKGLPWEKAKAFDGSAFVSVFQPKQNFEDINNINFSLNINKNTVQKGNTKDMLWNIDELISYVSKYFTLKKGDIIFTGTPAGVGKVNTGDILEGHIEGDKIFELKVR